MPGAAGTRRGRTGTKKMKKLIALLTALALLVPLFYAGAVFSFGDDEQPEAETEILFPDAFDLRNVEGKCYVTPVRSQAPFGTCWSFAAVAALESSILGAGLKGADGKTATSETLNLSEKQLAWFSAMP